MPLKTRLEHSRIAIIGLGYVGLPLSVEFGKQYDTVGFDINAARIAELRQGRDSTLEVEPELLAQAARLSYADTLTGNAWLELLEAGMPSGSFTTEPGNLIASGLFMADVSAETVEQIEARLRTRFVSWMTGR